MESQEPLAEHGDDFEKHYWPKFVRDEFPAYAEFWRCFVQPQREDPAGVRLKRGSASESPNVSNAVIVSELHYSTFMHLAYVYDLRHSRESYCAVHNSITEVIRLTGAFTDAIAHLSSATDTADELLERVLDERYEAWSEKASERARRARRSPDPLPALHNYRNRLVHGPLITPIITPYLDIATRSRWFELHFQRFEKLPEKPDWRAFQHGEIEKTDFAPARDLVEEAWTAVLGYLEREWTSNLLPLAT